MSLNSTIPSLHAAPLADETSMPGASCAAPLPRAALGSLSRAGRAASTLPRPACTAFLSAAGAAQRTGCGGWQGCDPGAWGTFVFCASSSIVDLSGVELSGIFN